MSPAPPSPALPSPALFAIAGVFALLAIVFAVAGRRALRGGRVLALGARTLAALLFLALAGLCLVLVGATQGDRALTREEIACEVRVEPAGGQSFRAEFVFPDGHQAAPSLKGDQLYVDAHILKWKPWANLLGLHTAYELDRVGGRYTSLDDERDKPRTVASLATSKQFDLFDLRRRYAALALLVDADYGSATFVDVRSPAVLEVRVSITGLLVRPKPGAGAP
jgi:hypothetical protein